MFSKIQILGFGSYYISVLYDIINDNKIAENIDVYRNIPASNEPVFLTKSFPIKIHDPNDIEIDASVPCVLGVSGGINKNLVFDYFLENFNISEESYLTVSDQTSAIASSSEIKKGCVLEHNVSVASQARLEFGVSIKRGASIGHHCLINRFVDINPGAVIAGKVVIGEKTTIGAGAIIIDGVAIGSNSIIGAGSVVTKNIPSNVIAYGNPCKIVRNND